MTREQPARKRGKLEAKVRVAAPSIRVWLSGTSWDRVQFLAFFSTKRWGKTMKKIALALSAMTLLGLAACAEFVGKGKAPAPAPAAPIVRKG
jgi:hypothetical protein